MIMNYELMTDHYKLKVHLNRKQEFEIKVLTKLFGPKRDKASGEFRMLHNGKHSQR